MRAHLRIWRSALRRSLGLTEVVALLAAAIVGGGLITVAVMEKRARGAQDKRTVARALVQDKRTVARALAEQQRVNREIAVTVRDNCQSIEALKVQVRGSLRRARKTLPTITYYREHPGELTTQLKTVNQELRRFERHSCKP